MFDVILRMILPCVTVQIVLADWTTDVALGQANQVNIDRSRETRAIDMADKPEYQMGNGRSVLKHWPRVDTVQVGIVSSKTAHVSRFVPNQCQAYLYAY